MWSKDEAKGMIVKHCFKASEKSKLVLKSTVQSGKKIKDHSKYLKRLRVCLTDPLNNRVSTEAEAEGLSRRYLWVWLSCNGINPNEIHRKSTKSLKVFYQQKHYQLGLKGTETVQNERPLDAPQILLAVI